MVNEVSLYKGSNRSTSLPILVIVHVVFFFFCYSHPSESKVVFHCSFDFSEIPKRFEQGMPRFHFTLGPANDVADPN